MAKRIAVVGAGSVGSYFGGMLARAGVPVTLIGRQAHVDAIQRDGLFLDGVRIKEHIKVAASVHLASAHDADVVLFCVKTLDTEHAAKAMAPHLSPNALVLSLQNGVDNVERIRSATGIDAVSTVVYVGASIPQPGTVKHAGAGHLVVGDRPRRAEIETVAAMFERAEVPARISDHIEVELWTKFHLNVAANAISALTGANYGRIAADARCWAVMEMLTTEVIAVAAKHGVHLEEKKLIDGIIMISKAIPDATSSTAQDIAKGRPTEMDSLNGYVVKLANDAGIPVPVNQTLYALVKLLEEKR
ncbi:MAG: ketopantoate reductase family protein [Vulcanimicrobiaceae bacterium]